MDVGLPQLKIVPILNLPLVVQQWTEALAEWKFVNAAQIFVK